MADSIREQIFQEIETTINGVSGIKFVSRGKIDATTIPNYPACFIVPGSDDVIEEINTRSTRTLSVFLFLWIKTQSYEIHKAVEEFLPKVQQKMVADNTLGGLAIDVTETNVHQPFPMSEDQSEAGIVLEFAVLYRVNRTNPYSSAP